VNETPARSRPRPTPSCPRRGTPTPNTRRGYTGVLDRLLACLDASRPLAEVSGEELAGLLEQLWGQRAPATWNRNRGAVAAWLSWCAANRLPAPVLPASEHCRSNVLDHRPRDVQDVVTSTVTTPVRRNGLAEHPTWQARALVHYRW
jgi:hypothetical protein